MICSSFEELLRKARGSDWIPPSLILSFDPGETTGWAMFKDGKLIKDDHFGLETYSDTRISALPVWELFEEHLDHVIIEGYRIYKSKAIAHTWNPLFTPKLIGYIEAVCDYHEVPRTIQMASSKQFCNDDKLKRWGYYQNARSRHSRDAIRHGCYWLLFNGRDKK